MYIDPNSISIKPIDIIGQNKTQGNTESSIIQQAHPQNPIVSSIQRKNPFDTIITNNGGVNQEHLRLAQDFC